MKTSKLLATAGVTGVVIAGSLTGTAFAWHPKGVIVKSVQNQTTNSALSDANTAASAVSAKPGDVLKYVIEVRNDGTADSKGYNDMAKTVMTDTLPAGVELVSDPAQRTISVDMGTIKPGQKVTKEYVVKVTAATNDQLVENKACFTGDSTANDNPQKGCDVADIKVSVPETPKPPTPPVVPPTTPEQPKGSGEQTPAPAQELPNTGAGDFIAPVVGAGLVGYAINTLRLKRRATQS
ncbi:MAG TPA: hypothetical protein VMY99_05660 [Nevskiaceae bacterium]|nr:hypothetical protein [Nevskiaceae bacterium]